MADVQKQPHANHVTNEPPVPPRRRRLWRPGRGADGGRCSCFRILFLIAAAAAAAAVRNTNKKIGIHFYSTDSHAYYGADELDSWESSMSFYLPPRSGTSEQYGGSYEGQRRVSLSSREIRRFNKRKSTDGVFPIVMMFRILNAFKVDKMHIGDFRNKVECRLKVPLISTSINGKSGNATSTRFKDTKCEFYFNPFIVIYTE